MTMGLAQAAHHLTQPAMGQGILHSFVPELVELDRRIVDALTTSPSISDSRPNH